RLEHMGLDRLGLIAPLSLRVDRSSSDPYFISGTDVLASGLGGLRTPRSSATSWGLALRRSRRGTEWWQKGITDNLAFQALYTTTGARTELSDGNTRLGNARLDYTA